MKKMLMSPTPPFCGWWTCQWCVRRKKSEPTEPQMREHLIYDRGCGASFLTNKKGSGLASDLMVVLIIAAICIVIFVIIFGTRSNLFAAELTTKSVGQKLEACKAKGEKGQLDGTEWPDSDKDGLPDNCDNCPEIPNFDWDKVKDKDGDGFPAWIDSNKQKCCIEYKTGGVMGILSKKTERICEDDDEYGPLKLFAEYEKKKG